MSEGPTKRQAIKPKLHLSTPTSLLSYDRSAEFVTTPTNLKETLNRFGVAIIPSVLSEDECSSFERGMWQSLEHLSAKWTTSIVKSDSSTWSGLSKLFPLHSMLLQHHGLGHTEFVWELRQNPRILEIFTKLWSTDDLLVSFDGVSIHMPPELIGGRGKYRNNTWYHTDQRLSDNSFSCVQSWVTALPVRPGDATLTVLVGSHAFHSEFAQRFGLQNEKEDWYKLASQEQLDFFIREKQCVPVSIACPAGSLVLWDSRTMHAGQESLIDRAAPNHRMIVYLCYTPRTRATKKDLEKKKKAFNEMRMTSHWPHKIKLFPKQPRTYGADTSQVVPFEKPTNVNSVGMKLAGF